MTKKIKSAIEALKLTRDTRFFIPKNEVLELSIRSLQAWEEVLQELEGMKCEYDCTTNEFQRGANAGANFIRNKAIDIINQKLAEIKE